MIKWIKNLFYKKEEELKKVIELLDIKIKLAIIDGKFKSEQFIILVCLQNNIKNI